MIESGRRFFILGIDPGSLITGYGLIEKKEKEFLYKTHGVFRVDKHLKLADRLRVINENLKEVFSIYQPQETVIEKIFFDKNAESAFKLGHVRGVCLLQASKNNSKIYEYVARTVKKSITGKGNATKNHLQFLIEKIFNLDKNSLSSDASDALALALTHARKQETLFWTKEHAIHQN